MAMLSTESSNTAKARAQLKMSYYTSPYNKTLFPLRIQIAVRLPTIADDELSSFIAYELTMAIRDNPDLQQAVVSAFRNGSPAGRHFLEVNIGKENPQLLGKMQSIKQ